jgi:hypothetical protein
MEALETLEEEAECPVLAVLEQQLGPRVAARGLLPPPETALFMEVEEAVLQRAVHPFMEAAGDQAQLLEHLYMGVQDLLVPQQVSYPEGVVARLETEAPAKSASPSFKELRTKID